jgi:hypothetical protein
MKLQNDLYTVPDPPTSIVSEPRRPPQKSRLLQWRKDFALITMALPGIIVLLVFAYLWQACL